MFAEAARVLRYGGRLAIADMVTDKPLTPQIVANTHLWASCIGGAAHTDAYQQAVTAAGLEVVTLRRAAIRHLRVRHGYHHHPRQ